MEPNDKPAQLEARQACLRAILRMAGLRPTRQRLIVADKVIGHNRHFSAADLYRDCAGTCRDLSLATIYNTLHQFQEHGLIRALVINGTQSLYDSNTSDHGHYLVEETGELIDMDGPGIELEYLPRAPKGYLVERVEVIVHVRDKKNTAPPPTTDAPEVISAQENLRS